MGLTKNNIDYTIYISFSLKQQVKQQVKQQEKEIALDKNKNGQTIFIFVTPEHLQKNTFRVESLRISKQNNHYFSYSVIDEAHCASEYGDMISKSSYLHLGNSAKKYYVSNIKTFTFFLLTAKVSYNVLSEIRRGVDISEETTIVKFEIIRFSRNSIQNY
ncbi:hypothetical protein [Candidatus Azobacteroides pseudotrichonymphae]|uniref:hypothetical protein n=1 Tax=Candidatus Azobacteroides pseudotrichonymphae TaxID=511435 RepID=UPI0002DDD4B5|nr:hypothetical protein [Candidatus Azobacteroides pseudotrichonymphae]